MRAKFVSIFAVLLLLGACESTPETDEGASSGGASSVVVEEETMTETEVLPGPVPGSQEDLTVQVGDRIFFQYDSDELDPVSRETLEKLAIWMNNNPSVTITIEGNCDERGTREYNLALGERRANSGRNFLIALGINPNRVNTISYGKERPAVLGSNDYAWSQNRNDTFSVN